MFVQWLKRKLPRDLIVMVGTYLPLRDGLRFEIPLSRVMLETMTKEYGYFLIDTPVEELSVEDCEFITANIILGYVSTEFCNMYIHMFLRYPDPFSMAILKAIQDNITDLTLSDLIHRIANDELTVDVHITHLIVDLVQQRRIYSNIPAIAVLACQCNCKQLLLELVDEPEFEPTVVDWSRLYAINHDLTECVFYQVLYHVKSAQYAAMVCDDPYVNYTLLRHPRVTQSCIGKLLVKAINLHRFMIPWIIECQHFHGHNLVEYLSGSSLSITGLWDFFNHPKMQNVHREVWVTLSSHSRDNGYLEQAQVFDSFADRASA